MKKQSATTHMEKGVDAAAVATNNYYVPLRAMEVEEGTITGKGLSRSLPPIT
jgi:hypothetical protein